SSAPRAPRPRSRLSRPHAGHEHQANDAEDHSRHPGREIGWDESLATNRLGELDEHEEDDRRGEADADAVGSPSALRARRQRRAEEGDDDARRRDRDLERTLDAKQVGVAPRSLLSANEARELLVAHLLGAAWLRHHLDRAFGETPVAEAVE